MTRTLATVERAVRVLEAFDADHTEWTLTDLAEHLGQATSTLHEQLTTLSASGLLMRVGRRRYQLGWRLLKLSSALYGSVPWYAPAHDAMNTLARGTHLLTFLAVLQRGPGQAPQVLCIARSVQGRQGNAVAGETQFVLPPHASASGKLLYALHGLDLPPELPTYTPFTLQVPWQEESAHIRRARLAMTRDEWEVGTSGLAVPIMGEGSQVLGALGISLPTARLREVEQLSRRLQEAATEASWVLGFRRPAAAFPVP
ncbi:IclR family transcriptional regulator [Deinococcus ruber]|uniref:IclR family transcriptional regulator n=1 Tax=Deinococcus ruber TaxID=1848197 RepID=A0A918F5F8_9DEIO|nr:IclR family transcriptional regulator [Deinococcus ruber]GGR06267.1 IclR family transcriptional regulator [Deinococcus ruber]